MVARREDERRIFSKKHFVQIALDIDAKGYIAIQKVDYVIRSQVVSFMKTQTHI